MWDEARRLLVESSRKEEAIASMQKARVVDFEELKTRQRRNPKLLNIRQRVRKSRGPMHYSSSRMIPYYTRIEE